MKRTYISLFSSAGVGCFGFDKEKFQCVATNELIEERLNVQRANEKCKYPSGYIAGDISLDTTKERLLEQTRLWEEKEGVKKIDVVFATPPCQGMSTANYKKTDEQKRNSLVVEAIKVIDLVRPKVFIIENVRAFMKTKCTDLSGAEMSIRESIERHLSPNYHLFSRVINFKDYGVPSSRPRTIVIGTSKMLKNIAPLNLFPVRKHEITLREAIGHLPSLGFGEKDTRDFLHFARKYPPYQEAWIDCLKEGQSAFENPEGKKPYKLDAQKEKVALKGAHLGNKYRRLYWDKPGACIATRNDQLASQDTIHPSDNRVLSIRELMRLMTIPDDFKWAKSDDTTTPANSGFYLKANELNIRRCIGEAVPTRIIKEMADRAATMLDFEDFVERFNPTSLADYLADDRLRENFYIDTYLKEQQIENAKSSGAFYTPQCVVFDAIKCVNIDKPTVSILEPSVGLGAFIPQLCALFASTENVTIDAVDVDAATIASLKESLQKIDLGNNIEINFIRSDFLSFDMRKHYDLIATNPPYAKTTDCYKELTGRTHKTKNLFALFLLKIFGHADDIVCIIPKNFAIADEFSSVRKEYQKYPIVRICDFGVKYFKKVFVEIVSIHFSRSYKGPLEVVDHIHGTTCRHKQKYIYHKKLWLLYRNAWFDRFLKELQLDVFDYVRDRQITNSKIRDKGRIRVLRSKNITDRGEIVSIAGYDRYIDDVSEFSIGNYLNTEAIIMPNFTYNTRASVLPKNSVPNGSIAILLPKKKLGSLNLKLYATPEFKEYYAIVKSRSKFTLNIDNSSIYYIGVKK